jgi:hypothetical protein
MQSSLGIFAEWLSNTALSQLIQNTSWVIPGVQSIHILSIALVMSSAIMLLLRVLGVVMRDLPTAQVAQRFLPWIWYPLIVLLVSGAILIVGEPQRSLTNSVFQLKMVLLVAAIACTLTLQRPLRTDAMFWENTAGARAAGKLIAVASLGLWSAIIFAGRWIAYAG